MDIRCAVKRCMDCAVRYSVMGVDGWDGVMCKGLCGNVCGM